MPTAILNWPLRSDESHCDRDWSLRSDDAHCDCELAVVVRRCPMRSRAGREEDEEKEKKKEKHHLIKSYNTSKVMKSPQGHFQLHAHPNT